MKGTLTFWHRHLIVAYFVVHSKLLYQAQWHCVLHCNKMQMNSFRSFLCSSSQQPSRKLTRFAHFSRFGSRWSAADKTVTFSRKWNKIAQRFRDDWLMSFERFSFELWFALRGIDATQNLIQRSWRTKYAPPSFVTMMQSATILRFFNGN